MILLLCLLFTELLLYIIKMVLNGASCTTCNLQLSPTMSKKSSDDADDDDEDEEDDKMLATTGLEFDPERLKAFNVCILIFLV